VVSKLYFISSSIPNCTKDHVFQHGPYFYLSDKTIMPIPKYLVYPRNKIKMDIKLQAMPRDSIFQLH
jgi:hypothetical protein